MSILIKGMEMPPNCDACPMLYEYRLCSLTDDHASSIERKTEEKRMPNCPLVELPDHGDLIDKDAFYIDLMDRGIEQVQTDDLHEIGQALHDAPVVIPAERSEE